MERFRKLGIIDSLLKSIQEQNFEKPSEIQEKAIPLIMDGKDVIAAAATGSGKTLAFASGIIKNTEKGMGIQSLILTPTRELAVQVCETLQRFSKHKHLGIIAVYGGVSIINQISHLRTADIVVGTPGRLLDHMERRTINLDRVKILVLDEADRMLDMGFKYDVERIISNCPRNRQTLLFSATISYEISRLARRYMNDPIEVSAEVYVDPSKLTQIYYDVEDNKKFSLLVHFLKNEKSELIMVFCNTQRNTDFVANNLNANGINALAIHGGYSQEKRTRTMEKFHAKYVSVLVCTDVAARGLDIKGVSHIYNYDIPKSSDDYIHRIGRTARAGKEGKVINILSHRDYENFREVMRNSELNIVKAEVPPIESIFLRAKDSRTRGRGFDRRYSRGDNRRYSRKDGSQRSHENRQFYPKKYYGNSNQEREGYSSGRSFGRRKFSRDRHNRFSRGKFHRGYSENSRRY